jgi:hypothetical protein
MFNSFPNAFHEKSVKDNELNTKYNTRVEYLHVSSSDRDLTMYPDVNHYAVDLYKTFKNISSIELIQATIPNVTTDDPYVILKISEIDPTVFSLNSYVDGAFAIIPFIATTGKWVNLNCNNELIQKIFVTPKSTLDRMTIDLYAKNGSLFSFGSSGLIDNDFVFKITTIEKDRSDINFHSVY